jgi:hypothetical protein
MNKVVLFNEWSAEYPQRRYLERDSTEQLDQRQADLIDNILTIGADGCRIVNADEQFRRLLAHVHTELALRKLPVPVDYKQRTYVHCKRAAELWKDVALQDGTYLLKFGNAKWMIPMLRHGSIRVTNAKWYDDPSLNPAVRDRELEFTEELYDATIEVPPNSIYAVNGQSTKIETIGNVRRVAQCTTDFYIACFGIRYDYRLFDDFSREGKDTYNACLVIPDPQRFIHQMRQCGERELPGWEFAFFACAYRDPHHPRRGYRDVFFTKHFRYAYQREFRMVWTPPSPQERLEPVMFNLGSLENYCRLLVL